MLSFSYPVCTRRRTTYPSVVVALVGIDAVEIVDVGLAFEISYPQLAVRLQVPRLQSDGTLGELREEVASLNTS